MQLDEAQPNITDTEQENVVIKTTPIRRKWDKKTEFFLSCISTAVGLGNIWRFPYLCFQHGGGAFLIPYVISLTIIGMPLFFMELALGQFASLGAIGIWKISPLFKGIGFGMVTISAIVAIYYNVVIAQCLYFFVSSFTTRLPWMDCNNTWNNKTICYDGSDNTSSVELRVSPAEEFYERYVLDMSSGIADMGLPQWKLVICLFVCWSIVAVILLKGIKYIGKVSYFTALFPYVILTIFLIKGLTLPGSLSGILYYVTPRFEYLKRPQVWVAAATQIFFSLSVCNGNIITVSSYSHFSSDCLGAAVTVVVINCLTSLYGGLVIFANMGFMAHVNNVTMSRVFRVGPGLAFKAYPEAISQMSVSPLWSVLFFLMMLTLGISSHFALVETVLSGFEDYLRRYHWFKNRATSLSYRIIVCTIGFVLGVPLTCRGGIYLLGLMDESISGFSMLVLAILEILVVSYSYGVDQFLRDITMMTQTVPSRYWKYCWMGITPAALILLILSIIIFPDNDDKKYPVGFVVLKYILSLLPLLFVVVIFLFRYCQRGGFLLFKELLKPHLKWGPANEEHKSAYDISVDNSFFQSKESIANRFLQRVSSYADPQNSNLTSRDDINNIAQSYCELQTLNKNN